MFTHLAGTGYVRERPEGGRSVRERQAEGLDVAAQLVGPGSNIRERPEGGGGATVAHLVGTGSMITCTRDCMDRMMRRGTW